MEVALTIVPGRQLEQPGKKAIETLRQQEPKPPLVTKVNIQSNLDIPIVYIPILTYTDKFPLSQLYYDILMTYQYIPIFWYNDIFFQKQLHRYMEVWLYTQYILIDVLQENIASLQTFGNNQHVNDMMCHKFHGFYAFFKKISHAPFLCSLQLIATLLYVCIYFLFLPFLIVLTFPFLQYFLLFTLFSLCIISLSYNIFYFSCPSASVTTWIPTLKETPQACLLEKHLQAGQYVMNLWCIGVKVKDLV